MRYYSLLVALVLLASGCTNQTSNETLRIATAANMQFAMDELIALYQQESGQKTEMIVGSSGKLTAQIKQSAPFDLFVSANLDYPSILFQESFTTSKPVIYGYGKLVLWSCKPDLKPTLDQLSRQQIALANPTLAPYGIAGRQVLNNLKLWDSVRDQLVYGESISQTNQFITSQAVDVGFTALASVRSPQVKGKGQWSTVPDSLYQPIAQAAVIIKGEKVTSSEKFLTFLLSENARKILRDYGYETPQ
jgi:molybdate transport system substrate-binding protein